MGVVVVVVVVSRGGMVVVLWCVRGDGGAGEGCVSVSTDGGGDDGRGGGSCRGVDCGTVADGEV